MCAYIYIYIYIYICIHIYIYIYKYTYSLSGRDAVVPLVAVCCRVYVNLSYICICKSII